VRPLRCQLGFHRHERLDLFVYRGTSWGTYRYCPRCRTFPGMFHPIPPRGDR
jgi:hypothetical protein